MTNIVKRELRAHVKSLVIWSACISILNIAWISEFSAYYNNPEMAAILDAVPDAMLRAFSMNAANLTTLSGYVSLVATFVYIILGVHAVLLGSSILSKEERDKTVEFLMTLPVSRQKVVAGKAIAAAANCVILLGVTWGVLLASIVKYEPDQSFYKLLGALATASIILQILFLSIGMLMASILKRYKRSGSISVAILLVSYFLSVLIGFSDKIEFLKYITPFKYFETVYLLNENRLEGIYVIISLCIILLAMVGTFVFYRKRDLHI
jgi:ABC-2 type transport system permease protein